MAHVSACLLLLCGCALADVLLQDIANQKNVMSRDLSRSVYNHSTKAHHRVKRGTVGSRLNFAERVDFLNSHNQYRKNVTPTASNMQFMVWHEELAAMAQEWADRCVFAYGNPPRDPPPFPLIGQNVNAETEHMVTGFSVTTTWYSESLGYDYQRDSCDDYCKNYEQMVWANAKYLGCGMNFCPVLESFSRLNAKFIVCNYGPGSDLSAERPYLEGVPCSSCPSGNICEDNLCIPNPKCGTKVCNNGGTLDPVSCECDCPFGYDGSTCTDTASFDARATGYVPRPLKSLYIGVSLVVIGISV